MGGKSNWLDMKNKHTESKYEASYYVKWSLKNSFGETCFMNL